MTFQVSGSDSCEPMRLDVLRWAPQRQRPLEQFTAELLSLLCLLQSSWCLPVVTRPNFETGAWSTRYCCSLMLPYCCPSFFSTKSTCLIQSDTGLYGCPHSCKKPPPQPMSKDFCRIWWLRFSTGRSSGVPDPFCRCS